MKKLNLLIFSLGLLIAFGCNETKKDTTVIETPAPQTPRQEYTSNFTGNDALFKNWEGAFNDAQNDSTRVTLPYAESGVFTPKQAMAHSYTFQLRAGENLIIALQKQPDSALVFIDLFRNTEDSLRPKKLLISAKKGGDTLTYKSDAYGLYTLIVQPELAKKIPFQLKMYTQPMYIFPVSGTSNAAVRSFWAANRGEGKRTHEGIDIFAKKGTPVLAIVSGVISETADRGKGGKQVWLKDSVLGTSIYHAHLDAISVETEARVTIGDTLGFVGNTGNADDTEPHLHFGIYLGETGPVDPYPYIKQTEIPVISSVSFSTQGIVKTKNTLLYQGPSSALDEVGKLSENDTISLLGKYRDWFRIATPNGTKGFVSQTNIILLTNTKAQD